MPHPIHTPELLQLTWDALDAARGHWPQVAESAGVSFSTLCKLRDGRIANPGIWTVQAIYDALQRLEAREARIARALAEAGEV